ncbi:MAG TPA: aminodeoxychorismate synthase component I, partial [Solirubrobacterales bacterium]|nr:aminodeoxychorismate synthase component I [Solirubrobacterales bacterium]
MELRQPRLLVRRIDGDRDAELAFARLYGERSDAFWLDSSRVGEGARFSFLGAPGPLGEVITRRVGEGESIFDHLSEQLQSLRLDSPELPFGFNCGFVGWFGYELKAETGGRAAHAASTPDAAFLFVDRLVAFDHEDGRTYLLCLAEEAGEGPGGIADGERWLAETAALLEALPPSHGEPERIESAGEPVEFHLARSREHYLEDIAACKRALYEGESYEICLTNQVRAAVAPEPLALYRALRRVNPAPYAALLRIGSTAVLSSSPERFLRIGADGAVEAKPIKGTSPRAETPEADEALAEALRTSEKNRAENLMITDLLRNDLGTVCEVGSVHVPHLMAIETFETVHQLVSTVRGRLRDGLDAVDCIRACFPGGSMTGAPKKRTMEIIDELETEARGVYSGAIGYIGLGGAADLNIVIRTVVMSRDETSIGVGGAIVMQSDADEEYQETLLKAQ